MKNLRSYFLIALLIISTSPIYAQQNGKKFKVVLDAGHGGHDPGNMGSGFKEKDIALSIVLKVGAMLQKNKDIEVIYTRKTDKFVDLFVRGKIANEAEADLFVSVHCNAHNSSAHGTETWVLGLDGNKRNMEVAKKENSVIYLEENYEVNYAQYDLNSPESFIGLTMMQEEYLDQSILLAKMIQDNFTGSLKRKDRGVKQNVFIVLHQTVMPSVLVETGFLTYKPEGKYLNSNGGQQGMASSIAKAVLAYKKSVDENTGDVIDETSLASIVQDAGMVSSISSNDVVFKIQIAAGSNKLDLKPYNFKGLSPVTMQEENGVYRYFYGETTNFETAKSLQKEANGKGYQSCFIVAYKNGQKMSLSEAVKSISN
ncbi:N-acetylmuramoyl-L-alanine amidase [Zhouia amylolytica]|uniref:N-acetylmuramoyl-L-alanine amidase n=1 Tax=Zhouia amylolytica TaxID=376730 RepID=UPI0020CE566F|nr:N-acetylmuramoyl-L-alanine amidase [Zhouia amylolytica]MCQ0112301.1 N-acetylmuramoyl-L-alanine amidase [Zhouia amylolytica]